MARQQTASDKKQSTIRTYNNISYNESSYKSDLNNDEHYFTPIQIKDRIVSLTQQITIDLLVNRIINISNIETTTASNETTNKYSNPYFSRHKKFYALLNLEIIQNFVISNTVNELLDILRSLRIASIFNKQCDICNKYKINYSSLSGHFYCESCYQWMSVNADKKLLIKPLGININDIEDLKKYQLTRYHISEMKDKIKNLNDIIRAQPAKEKEFYYDIIERCIFLIKDHETKRRLFSFK